MAATAVDLDLTDAEAKKVVKLAIEHGAYSDEMPDNKKGRLEAAAEAVEFCVDSWVNDGVRPDDDDEDVAAAGEAIQLIFEAAGIDIDEDGTLIYESSAEAEEDDDEAPFDPDDYFDDGYTELTAASKVKALGELDLEDADTLAIVARIKEWEEEQDKPSSRVLSWIEENVEMEDDEAEDDEDPDELDEPWDGYDKATAVDIKTTLDEVAADEDEPLTVEQLEYVKSYEEARKTPRKRILDKVDEMIEALSEAEEEETKPALKATVGKKASTKATGKSAAKVVEDNGLVIELTREQILQALDSGSVTIEVG